MLPDKAKSVVFSIISLGLSFWMKQQVIGQFCLFLKSVNVTTLIYMLFIHICAALCICSERNCESLDFMIILRNGMLLILMVLFLFSEPSL